MNPPIKKIIVREALIILAVGILSSFCFILTRLLESHVLAEIFGGIGFFLIIGYIGLWVIRIFLWRMRMFTGKKEGYPPILAAHYELPKPLTLLIVLVIIGLLLTILITNGTL